MKSKLENVFLLSPFIILVSVIFNIVDTKFILSRLIPVVCIYCLFFFREAIKENLRNDSFRIFSISTLLVILYFTTLHLVRGDEFTLARTLIAALAYMLFLPWNKIPYKWILLIVAIGGISAGINGLYEHYFLGIERVGIASNPIPYAFYCASMVLFGLHFTFCLEGSERYMRCVSFAGSLFSGYALILTEVRGVWLAIPICVLILLYNKLTRTKSIKILPIAIVVSLGLFVLIKPIVTERYYKTLSEYEQISNGNYDTSIGMRLVLWKNGLEYMKENLLFGVGDESLEKKVHEINTPWASQVSHLHNQYIDLSARSGFIGLGLILFWITTIATNRVSGSRSLSSSPISISLVVLFFIASLTDVHLIHAHIVYLISILFGSVLVVKPYRFD